MEFIELVRQLKIGPFAIFDTALAYLGIFLLAPLLSRLALKAHLNISRIQWLWLVLPISILAHLLFGQETPLTNMVTDPSNFYPVKIVILLMLFMGLKDTRITKK